MKSLTTLCALLALLTTSCTRSIPKEEIKSPSEKAIRAKVVRLTGNGYMCSGEQVKAPSGVSYILSAGHCHGIANPDGSIHVIMDDGRQLERRVIAEDPASDQLLIEGLPGVEGLSIAKSVTMGEHVRTFTHGHNLDTYKTEGSLIQDKMVEIGLFEIKNPEQAAACTVLPKNKVVVVETFFGIPMSICAMTVTETVTNAFITHGSSGGAVVNDKDELTNIVSAGEESGQFNMLVTLGDIQRFLAGY